MQRKYSQEKLNIFENLYIKETEKQIKKLQEELAKAKEDAALALTQAETEKQKLVEELAKAKDDSVLAENRAKEAKQEKIELEKKLKLSYIEKTANNLVSSVLEDSIKNIKFIKEKEKEKYKEDSYLDAINRIISTCNSIIETFEPSIQQKLSFDKIGDKLRSAVTNNGSAEKIKEAKNTFLSEFEHLQNEILSVKSTETFNQQLQELVVKIESEIIESKLKANIAESKLKELHNQKQVEEALSYRNAAIAAEAAANLVPSGIPFEIEKIRIETFSLMDKSFKPQSSTPKDKKTYKESEDLIDFDCI